MVYLKLTVILKSELKHLLFGFFFRSNSFDISVHILIQEGHDF